MQSSISRFFSKKVDRRSQTSKTSNSLPPAKEVSLYDAEENDDDEPAPALRKDISKRTLIEVSSTKNTRNGSSDCERPPKRSKSGLQESESNTFLDVDNAKRIPNTIDRELKPASIPEKYLYSASVQSATNDTILGQENDGSAEKARKEELHQKWVNKMSNVQIGRRWQTREDKSTVEDVDGEGDEDDEPLPSTKAKKGAKTSKLTPMEIQFLDIKRKHMNTLLIMEVGYKFKFFGEDARTAAKELSIVCIPGKLRYDEHPSEAHLDRFASATIPTHRLSVHVKRLVQAGHKIGVVKQIETAALKKAGDNRNAPFSRKLTNVYTKGTYIDDVEGLNYPTDGALATGYLLCITESKSKGSGTDEKVNVGMLAVQPATGDIIYDVFEDGFMRGEIETRLLHLAPCELLIVGELSKATDKIVQHLSGSSTNVFGDRIRVEKVEKAKTMAAEAHSHIVQFYADKLKQAGNKELGQSLLDKVLKLPAEVILCLSAMITHMTEYGLEHIFELTNYFQSFSARSHMLLSGNTLTSLEIYRNQTDHSEQGSLFWTLDKTKTRFGQRLLRKWIGKPLLDKNRLEERINAVEELREGYQTPNMDKLDFLLCNIKSDLERSLLRIYYGKCTRPELLVTLQTLQRLSNEYAYVKSPSDAGFASPLINNALATLPSIGETIISFLRQINAEAAHKDDKYAFFHADHESEQISDHKLGIAAIEQELDAHRTAASNSLHRTKLLTYNTVAGIEYLFEVPNTDLRYVPASWTKVSGTKRVSRFHTPEVTSLLRERDQRKESLNAACDSAFAALLAAISMHYAPLRDTVAALSTLDCLSALAHVALLPGYTKPTFADTPTIDITGGRHPMVEMLLPTPYIGNTTCLSTAAGQTRALCITGPNMGGKSSYVRHVALLVLLAQIGSYLPCDAAHIGLFDGIYTRMGANDSLFKSQSTFQVELSETAGILAAATERSLVILDELGRGTSTHDGVAIASATLDYLVREKRCICMFITHYQSLAGIAKAFEGDAALRNVHMRFESTKVGAQSDRTSESAFERSNEEKITFLYEVGEGVAHRSYGLNVARLAQIPKTVLNTAAKKSFEMEIDVKEKKLKLLSNMMNSVLFGETGADLEELIVGIEEL